MRDFTFEVKAPLLGEYDVAVCGGGIAGFCAAVSAARNGSRVVLIENGGYLGGSLTQGNLPYIMDADNKGGLVSEMLEFLNQFDMTCPRSKPCIDENGNRVRGSVVDFEGAKYFFDKACKAAGVQILYHSMVVQADVKNDVIGGLLVSADGGNHTIKAKVFIDASGNGNLAFMAGNDFETGDPETGFPQPMSVGMVIGGYPDDSNVYHKKDIAEKIREHGIEISSDAFALALLPSLKTWNAACTFLYNVKAGDIIALSEAIIEGRKQSFETIMKMKKLPEYENVYLISTNEHIGVREGRRIIGKYRLGLDDILNGVRFDDGICLVRFGVDVHKLKPDDTDDITRGHRAQPYHIPYRSLVPAKSKNLLLAGRCISGDFYAHASYRVMGNMAATGEAAGFAASICVKESIAPKKVDGRAVSEYMKKRGYEI